MSSEINISKSYNYGTYTLFLQTFSKNEIVPWLLCTVTGCPKQFVWLPSMANANSETQSHCLHSLIIPRINYIIMQERNGC